MKRFFAFLLTVAILFSVVACAAPDGPARETGNNVGGGTGTGSTHADPGLPSEWYDNQSFRIMGSLKVSRDDPARDIVYFEDKLSDNINEAVHDRNIYVEELYGVSIEAVWSEADSQHVEVEKAINAGLPNCDVMETGLYYYSSLVDQGYLADLHSMSQYLDVSQPWWDQNARKNLSLGGALYFAAGDIMITDKMAARAITFNRDMITNYNLEDAYELVNSYRWTYDKMYEMAAAVSNAEFYEQGDYFSPTWGLASDISNNMLLWYGCGVRIFEKDENDLPVLNELTETAYDAMMDIAAMQYDKKVTIFTQDIKGIQDAVFDGVVKIFQTGHALFKIGSITMIEWMREYDMDFGILPMPMANEEQRGYYAATSNNQTYAVAVPAFTDHTQKDYDRIGIILQALACESTATLLEAYYDKTLTYRGLRRPEDQAMLDKVFDGRMFDLSLVFSWADAFLGDLSAATTESKIKRLKTYYDSYASSINKRVNDYLVKHGLA